MTIVVGVSTPEGLVLASDSRTTTSALIGGTPQLRIGSDNAQKVFEVGDMGVATYGIAFLSRDTIAGVMDEFAVQVQDEEKTNIHKFAPAVAKFFDARYTQHLQDLGQHPDPNRVALGFLVAGYDDSGVGYIKEVEIPGGTINQFEAVTNVGGMMWRGQTEVVGRLLRGVDWVADLSAANLSQAQVQELEQLRYIGLEPLSLQDGIDFASFLVRTTVDMQRFSNGTAASPGGIRGCGGPTQLLAIERSGPTWVEELTLQHPSRPGLAAGAQR